MATSGNSEEQKGQTGEGDSPQELTETSTDEVAGILPVYGPLPRPTDTSSTVTCFSKDVPDPDAVHGRCGLYNLGNTCFMNSGLQCLLSSATLVKFLFTYKITDKSVKSTLLGQFHELLGKVWSGKYSILYPRDFKQTLGLYHPQFQDYRQHDCQEFLALLLDTLHEQLNYSCQNPANQISELGPTFKDQPIESDVSMNNQSLNTSLVNERNEDQSKNIAGSHSSLTFENIKHSDRQGSNSDEQKQGKITANQSEKDVNCSNLVCFSSNTISEDSNHSTASGCSSDSEQCSVLKNLNLRNSPVVPCSQSDEKLSPKSMNEIREGMLSSSACISKNEEMQISSSDREPQGARKKTFCDVSNMVDVKCQETQGVWPDGSVRVKKSVDETGDFEIKDCESKSDVDLAVSASLEDQPVILNNAVPSTSVHSLEDIYAKETKTLNTNVLAEEFLPETVAVDSDKFMKQDNTRLSSNRPDLIEEEGLLNNILEASAKKDDDCNPRPLKDVNLRADKKSKLSKATCASGKMQNLEQDDYDMNSVKRMKFEGTEKNLQMQELSKINKERILFGTRRVNMEEEPTIDIDADSDSEESENQDVEMELSEDDDDETDGGEAEVLAVGNSFTTSEVIAAEAAWQKYLSKNDSVIVDTFQGQFKSTVICSECNQVSVTFEPFMYLSVPIPHAMERQICVTFISPAFEPTRYLLNLNKHDKIQRVKQELCSISGRQDCEIVLAEVLDWHISRILEDNSMLRYVNDTSRKIYAFELEPLKAEAVGNMSTDLTRSSDVTLETGIQDNDSARCDIFSHMGSFSAEACGFDTQSSYSSYQDTLSMSTSADIGFGTAHSGVTLTSDIDMTPLNQEPSNSDLIGTNMWEWSNRTEDQVSQGDWNLSNSTASETGIMSEVKTMSGAKDSVTDEAGNGDSTLSSLLEDKWKSCAICLEELTDNELMVHTSCGGTFCPSCLEMSVQHYGELSYCCPVCSTPAELTEDFVPLASAANHRPKTRIVAVPITFRYETDSLGRAIPGLFAHPSIMNLPSNLSGEYIYGRLKDLMSFSGDFKVVLTDGQGLHCSRCLYMEHCSGCEIPRDGEAVLRPGDHLTVCVPEVAQNEIEHAQRITDHSSMEKQRSKEPITLLDCFRAFTQSEELDEHNPWFCPHCQKNQLAKKTMTVWQYPDTLIIQLKRFVFHELSGTKVDNIVQFPIDNLDLSQFISGPKTKHLQYSLYSCVCHFGGANSGHYTAYAKHPSSGQWYYYNDETVSLQSPGEDDFSSTYVLFYQRKGTDRAIQIPEEFDVEESHMTSLSCYETSALGVASHVTAVPNAIHEPPEGEISLDNKQPRAGVAVDQSEADSSLDFYS